MVFWRKPKDSGLGNVGFYVGEDEKAYQILGGNQSNSVCLIWIGKDRFLNAHWAKSATMLTSHAVLKKERGPLVERSLARHTSALLNWKDKRPREFISSDLRPIWLRR